MAKTKAGEGQACFKIDSIVWKFLFGDYMKYATNCFKIDSIVWKSTLVPLIFSPQLGFKIDSIVWKCEGGGIAGILRRSL